MQLTTFEEFSKEQIEEERWLVKPIVPAHGIILLHGSTDAGKSALLFTMTDAISCGGEFLGMPSTQGNVLFVNMDMPPQGLQMRIKGSTKSPKGFLIPYLAPINVLSPTFERSEEYEWLKEMVRIHDIKMVIFDTLSDLVVGKFSDDEVALGTYRSLRSWLPNTAIVVSHHDRKLWRSADGIGTPDDEDALGSQYWRSKAQSAIHLYKVNDVVRELVHTKSHSGEKLPHPIRLTLEDSAMRVEVWTKSKRSEAQKKYQEGEAKLKSEVNGKWNDLGEMEKVEGVARVMGVSDRTVWKWKKSMMEG